MKALELRGLSLPFSAAQNTWTQIVVGKDYSAAMAQATAQSHVDAIEISEESISNRLRERSRDIDLNGALKLFVDVVNDDIDAISTCISNLALVIQANGNSCVVPLASERRTGLGIITANLPGYVPVENFPTTDNQPQEVRWLKSNVEFAATLINQLGGIDFEKYMQIYGSSLRAASKKENDVLVRFLEQHGKSLSRSLSEKVMSMVFSRYSNDSVEMTFDELTTLIWDVLESEMKAASTQQLSSQCDLREAVIDHIAGRAVQFLKVVADNPADFSDAEDILSSLEHTNQLAIETIINIRKLMCPH